MNPSFQLSLPLVLAILCVLMTGNYFINRQQGVSTRDNLRETRMWGVGFIIYALLDYLILIL